MIAWLVRAAIEARTLVLLAVVLASAFGVVALRQTPLDAIPDLSDVQVIVRTTYAGQAPQVVEDQVTYPLTTTLMSVPHARVVRGYSLFGESYVYVLFDDGTDLYWARSRVLEYLSQVQGRLPVTARPALGPDATGVGWIYEYALVDRSGTHDIAALRALQDWFLKFELKSVAGVAEVATIGGFNRQYQIVLQPDRLRALGVTIETVVDAVRAANSEAGGSVIELAEAEYMVRARGYLKTLDDFRNIAVGVVDGTPILLADVAHIAQGGEVRRGIADLDGEGEVVGGVIVMRSGENASATIALVKTKLAQLAPGLPGGVEIVETYDRSLLIDRAVTNLWQKLGQEFAVVALVCIFFLWHLRSALVAVITLPVGILIAFIVMRLQGINADIMALGGIAIAIGAMVDAAVVMVENAHKHLERAQHELGEVITPARRVALLTESAVEVAPALFFSLLVITLSFVPVFLLEAQEGRLFAPLAYTKTYAMAAAAGLSVTLIPVLIVAFVRGHIRSEADNPLNRALMAMYRPVIRAVLARPGPWLMVAIAVLLATAYPIARIGSEFMPPLDEGDLLYMPTALPGIAAGKAAELLQQTDRIIKTFPEVHRVFGKAGRAESATDPAPLEMFETTIMLKDRSQWREGMSTAALIDEMDKALKVPGLANVWVQPIRNRIDMLATGIKSPVGVKIAGPDLAVIESIGSEIESVLKRIPGTASAFSERVSAGRYIEVSPDRVRAARHGLSIDAVQRVVALAIGGENVGETIEGLQRFPINIRYPRELRDSLADLEALPFVTATGETVTLGAVADVRIADGPPMIKSENSRPNGWVYVDIRDRDLGGYVAEAREEIERGVALPIGYSVTFSGQYEYLARATERLAVAVPFTLGVILLLLYLAFGNLRDSLLIMLTVPLSLVGGFWFIYLLGHEFSVASAVGFIALAGIATEFGVVMLLYLDRAVADRRARGMLASVSDLRAAIMEGAVQRVRPKAMTVAVIVAGLLPLFIGSGTGSEVMQRIAAPMVGGMFTAPVLSMIIIPVAYYLLLQREMRQLDAAHNE